ncbi:MAG: hypothetical protein K2H60_01490 [Muribaculaceae bacterium]|nr:hypothetical protein [Muribaculaceae bacterium]
MEDFSMISEKESLLGSPLNRIEEEIIGLNLINANKNYKLISNPSDDIALQYDSQEMRTLIADAAALCIDVYPISGVKDTPFYCTKSREWHLLSSKYNMFIGNGEQFAQELNYNSLINQKSGLHSYVFLQIKNNYVINIAYVFRGTIGMKDWATDIEQGVKGRFSPQYNQALINAIKLIQLQKRILPNVKIYFMGHSLGGGLAMHCGICTNTQVICFNPASVHPTTIGKYRDNYNRLMRNNQLLSVYVEGEFLSSKASSSVGLPKSGTRIGISKQTFNIKGPAAPFERHKMENICAFYGLSISNRKFIHYI